jgi:KEOPS complex subunit Pcc1
VTSRKSTSNSPHDAPLTFEYDGADRARRVKQSLRPEVDDIDGDRTRVSVTRTGRTVDIAVEAEDLVALRAGLNTWLTLVSVAESVGCPGA